MMKSDIPFYKVAEKYVDKALLESETGECTSYRDWIEYSDYLKTYLRPRTIVLILSSNSIGSIMGYLAFLRIGIVPLMLGANVDKNLLGELILVYKPEYIYAPQNYDGVDFLNEKCGYGVICGRYHYEVYKQNQKIKNINSKINSKLALLLTTSGSTGSRKFVRQSYKNISSNAVSIVEYLHLSDSERPITTLPMNYTYALSIIHSHVLVGATILVTDKSFAQKEFWDFFKAKEATSFGGVPYHYEMLRRMRIERMDIPTLKTMTQAGGRLSAELHRYFADFARNTGREFVVMYGQCEATARMSYLPPNRSLEKIGSVGIAIPGGRLSLIGEDNKEILTPDMTGELIYEGDNVTMGYAKNRDDLERGDYRRGRLATGDMATFDEEGYFYIVGRKKRYLKVYGNRVSLDEIQYLIQHEFELTVCECAGVDDHVYIFLTEKVNGNDIIQYLSRITGLNYSAFAVKIIDDIPRNESGKVLYGELEKYYDI